MQFSIDIDLGPVAQLVKGVMNEKVLPDLHTAVMAMAALAREDWMTAIHHAKLWQGERDNYAASIAIEQTGPFAARVWSEYKYAEEIETGRPAYDMKVMLRTSTKTRMGKKGVYLIIPIRHNMSSMPAPVYQAAKALSPSKVTSIGTRVSATGHTVAQRNYLWGGRLKAGAVPQMLRKHAGMVRFGTSTPGAPRSSYLTFRVMSASSTGWIKPPQPGIHIVEKVVEALRPQAEEAFSAALLAAGGTWLVAP
jgi:hypothetical protein